MKLTFLSLTEERLVDSGLVAEVRWQHCMEVRVMGEQLVGIKDF